VAELLAKTIAAAPVPSSLGALGVNAEQLASIVPATAEEIRRVCDYHGGLSDEAVAQMLLAAL
jgi:hypothetical protein